MLRTDYVISDRKSRRERPEDEGTASKGCRRFGVCYKKDFIDKFAKRTAILRKPSVHDGGKVRITEPLFSRGRNV
ncbi:hypothetical protein CMQ_4230 [Grosmannia clavigera kw1407]|uniref:Uncharacterized protein n=1 Tax=Grosmannia clavigera (strain kw1407 / UAMH 11150) TaxID=655863 RepID=F0X8M2_GROCL|nr:uncharacterized protein CMQ_4230 [Grosmannia clavigera kw1407]EFX06161.1 hypothetical protein CMQ_4230 [Grosmannia clavigera kw1407]